jgi:hypothetical protein
MFEYSNARLFFVANPTKARARIFLKEKRNSKVSHTK